VYGSLGFSALVPAGLVTWTSTMPGGSEGAVACFSVSDTTMNDTAGCPPNPTTVAPVKPVPVMVTRGNGR
jgi:hypothetical protein